MGIVVIQGHWLKNLLLGRLYRNTVWQILAKAWSYVVMIIKLYNNGNG